MYLCQTLFLKKQMLQNKKGMFLKWGWSYNFLPTHYKTKLEACLSFESSCRFSIKFGLKQRITSNFKVIRKLAWIKLLVRVNKSRHAHIKIGISLKINFVAREDLHGNSGFLNVQHCDLSFCWPVPKYPPPPPPILFTFCVCWIKEHLPWPK